MESKEVQSELLTKQLLLSISKRLSSRKDCRRVEYEVVIDEGGVTLNPDVMVYRNRYHRSECDKVPVSELAMSNLIYDSLAPLLLQYLVPGRYVYRLSVDGNRRKWLRIREDMQ